MPEILRIPNGTTKYGKPKYKKVIACTYSHCRKQGTVEEIRECERKHREEMKNEHSGNS